MQNVQKSLKDIVSTRGNFFSSCHLPCPSPLAVIAVLWWISAAASEVQTRNQEAIVLDGPIQHVEIRSGGLPSEGGYQPVISRS